MFKTFASAEMLLLLFILLFIITIIDLGKSNYPKNKKIIWGAICFFLPILGTALYFYRKQTVKDQN